MTVLPASPDGHPTPRVPGVGAAPAPPAAAVEGPGLAFDDFYREQYRALVALAIALTGSRAAAEDVVQEGFAAAYRRWSTVSGYDRPGAWLRRVVLHRATSLRRRVRTAAAGVARLGRDVPPTMLVARDAELWSCVRALPARQAQLVALVYVDQLTVAEAAAVVGCSPSSAKTHLARARQRLQRDLADWREP